MDAGRTLAEERVVFSRGTSVIGNTNTNSDTSSMRGNVNSNGVKERACRRRNNGKSNSNSNGITMSIRNAHKKSRNTDSDGNADPNRKTDSDGHADSNTLSLHRTPGADSSETSALNEDNSNSSESMLSADGERRVSSDGMYQNTSGCSDSSSSSSRTGSAKGSSSSRTGSANGSSTTATSSSPPSTESRFEINLQTATGASMGIPQSLTGCVRHVSFSRVDATFTFGPKAKGPLFDGRESLVVKVEGGVGYGKKFLKPWVPSSWVVKPLPMASSSSSWQNKPWNFFPESRRMQQGCNFASDANVCGPVIANLLVWQLLSLLAGTPLVATIDLVAVALAFVSIISVSGVPLKETVSLLSFPR